jgi:hypothetical protein
VGSYVGAIARVQLHDRGEYVKKFVFIGLFSLEVPIGYGVRGANHLLPQNNCRIYPLNRANRLWNASIQLQSSVGTICLMGLSRMQIKVNGRGRLK